MIPPPRRFSAAPSLSCPHRNKSSSHSSSSLHHTYSIDSSESMITVIPANRAFGANQPTGDGFGKRSSRGSLSCTSSAGAASGSAGGLELNGSFYALPRSPVSPSRCSPNLLTPNTSEPPFSPATTTTNTASSGNPNTVLQAQTGADEGQQAPDKELHAQSSLSAAGSALNSELASSASCRLYLSQEQLGEPRATDLSGRRSFNNLTVLSGDEENLSLAVENGTSYCSSRVDLDEIGRFEPTVELEKSVLEQSLDERCHDEQLAAASNSRSAPQAQFKTTSRQVNTNLNQNQPVIKETINDFCAKHSREELEFLVEQVGFLQISDCHLSERSSTLCMVIEVKEK